MLTKGICEMSDRATLTDLHNANTLLGFPLAESIPNRVGLLRGAGNAIVPQVAAEFIEFIKASMDCLS